MAKVVIDVEPFRRALEPIAAALAELGTEMRRASRAAQEWAWVFAIATAGEYVVTARPKWWRYGRQTISEPLSFGDADQRMHEAKMSGLFKRVKLEQISSPWAT